MNLLLFSRLSAEGRCPMSEVRGQKKKVRRLEIEKVTRDVRCPMSDVEGLRTEARCRMSDVGCRRREGQEDKRIRGLAGTAGRSL
jgi:hypothetical protein